MHHLKNLKLAGIMGLALTSNACVVGNFFLEVFGINGRGHIIPNEGKIEFKPKLVYDKSGRVIQERYDLDNDKKDDWVRYWFYNKRKTTIKDDWDNDRKYDRIVEQISDEKGRIIMTRINSDAKGDFEEVWKKSYDSQNNLTEMLYQNNVEGSSEKIHFLYDERNNNIETRLDLNGDGKDNLVLKRSYNLKNEPICVQSIQNNGLNTMLWDFSRNTEGEIIAIYLDWNNDGKHNYAQKYERENGQLIKIEEYWFDMKVPKFIWEQKTGWKKFQK